MDGAAPNESKNTVGTKVSEKIDVLEGADARPVGGAFPKGTVEFSILVVR